MNTPNCRMIKSINYRKLVKSYYLIAIFYILFFNTNTYSQISSLTIPKTTVNKADLIVASGDTMILAPTSHIYGNVLIQNDGILITRGDATTNTGATIVAEVFTIETGGMVSASQQGYQSGTGPGSGANAWLNYGAGGGGHGGWGGTSEAGTVAGKPYGELFHPQNLGSGGGNVDWAPGGSGGGALHIIVDGSLTIQGLIMADGGYGANSNGRNGGGGAGGSIWLEAKEITGTGEIHANGGSGGSTGRGIAGGGSGGRIAIYAESNLFSGTLSASGGSGAQFGGPGTIYLEDKRSNILYRKLLVDNHGHKGANAGLTSSVTQIWTFDEIKLIGHGNIELMDSDDTILISGNQMSGDYTSQFYVRGKLDASSVTELKGFGFYIYEQGNLVLPPNIAVKGVNLTNYGILDGLSNLTLVSGTMPPGQVVLSAQGHTIGSDVGTYICEYLRIEAGQSLLLNGNALTGAGVNLKVSDVDILSGGLVSATAMGSASSDGPGAGFDGRLNYGGGGGGHGGIGGTSEGGFSGGPSYGDIDQPQTLGSGGGNLDPYKGGAGGGAIHFMVNGSMKIWGKVTADGENGANVNGHNGGGGAGGSIWLEAKEITGTGEIHANGGAGGSAGRGVAGGGGGGRIAIQTDFLDHNIDISVAGGSGFESGNSGTISFLANIAPDDGGDYANNQITFTWVPLSGANAFRLEIATDTTEISIIDRLAVGNLLSFTYDKNLIEDVTYYARVAASKDSGLTFLPPSKFSDGITIDRTPPTVFTPTGRLLDDSRVQFVFKGADNYLLARYHIQIATDLSFQSPEIELKISADGIYTFTGTPGLTYYARAYAIDGAGNQSEYTAASNGVGLAPLADLTVSQVQVPPSAWSGQVLEVTWVVANIGPGSTNVPQWLDKVYLSADSTFDAEIAALLGSRPNVSFLNPGEAYTNRAEFILPRGMAGRYYVFVFADADDQLAESDGTNNVSRTTTPIQINLTPPPDLQITQFLTPENAFSGQELTISWTVKNFGTGKTETALWSDAVYFSTDSLLDRSQDRRLGVFAHDSVLAPDSSYTGTTVIQLPPAIYGTGYLFMVTDHDNQVYEHARESNNSRRNPIEITLTPPPDLVVTELHLPASAQSGQEITVSWTVQNQGPGAPFESGWSDRVYLSQSPRFQPDSLTVLGTFTHSGPLAPDSSYQAGHNLRLPNGISGHYYVFVKTDWNNQVFEHQFEDNNIRVSDHTIDIELAPWPDLQVVLVTTVTTASAGAQITVHWQVMNTGKAPTSATVWQDRIYLAPDSLWNRSGAILLAEVGHSMVLDSAASYQQTQQVILPANLSGSYYLYLVTDANNNLYEYTGEDNNIGRSDPLQVQAYPPVDLAVVALSGPDSVFSGQVIAVQWTVQNLGNARTLVSDWHDGIYLSGDSLLDRNQAVLLKRVRHSASLAATASYTQTEQVQLPNGSAGEYFLFVVTDLENRVADSDPANNYRRREHPLFIQATELPDLVAIALAGPSESQSGQPVIVRWSGQNTGTGSILNAAWQDAIFLSADSRLDATDQRLGSKSRSSPLLAHAVYHDSLEIEIPAHAVGAYYLLLKCDSGNDIYEAAEDNNTRAYLINVSLARPSDLVVSSITVPQSAIPGEDVTVSWTLQNVGENAAVGWLYDAVYISADTSWQVSDPMIGILYHHIDLAPGASMPARITVNLSKSYFLDADGNLTEALPGVLPGSYHLLVRTNIRASIRESDYRNNILASAEKMAVTIPMLQPGITQDLTMGQGRMKFYGVQVDANLNLRIKITSNLPAAINEVYVTRNRMPALTDYDYCQSEPQTADPQVLVPTTQAGIYYILVHARKLPVTQASENMTILVEVLPFSVFAIAPNRGGHGGRITCRITGAGFEEPMQAFLQDSQEQQYAGEILALVNSTELKIRWDLKNVPLGLYDLVVKKPDGQTEILPGAFTVEPLQNDQIYTDVQGPEALPGGRNAVYEIFVTNNNNIDADFIFLMIIVPNYQKFELKTSDFFGRPIPEDVLKVLEYPMAAKRIGEVAILICVAKDVPVGATLHATLVLYDIKGPAHGFSAIFIKAYALSLEEFLWRELVAIGIIRDQILASDSTSVPKEFRDLLAPDEAAASYIQSLIQTGIVGDGTKIKSTMPLRYDPAQAPGGPLAGFIDCEDFARSVEFAVGSYISIISVSSEIADVVLLAAVGIASPPTALALLAVQLGFILYDAFEYDCEMHDNCPDATNTLTSFREIGDWALAISEGIPGIAKKLLFDNAEWMAGNLAYIFCEEIVYPYDPNNIIGPAGFGVEKWINRNQLPGYRINFENDSTLATAPAQMILITQQLDSTVDARAFRLGKFGFGNFSFEIPENRSFFTDRLDVRDSLNLFVDVNFGIDVTTNQVFWRFQSIDPGTGQPPVNPYAGFLLVNDRWHRGQGFVHYTTRPKSTARTRDTIQAMADIVFDNNDPITTPEIFNTIDAGAPVSRVNPLPAQLDTTIFTVSWSGQDDPGGSGIRAYTLYLAEDDQPFRPCQTASADTFLVFAGAPEHLYQFFTIATDNAGNIEPMKTAAEASVITLVPEAGPGKIPTEFALYQNYPNPFNNRTTIKYDLPGATRVEILVYNILGQKVATLVDEKQVAGRYRFAWDGTNDHGKKVASGMYLYLIRTQEFTKVKKMILLK